MAAGRVKVDIKGTKNGRENHGLVSERIKPNNKSNSPYDGADREKDELGWMPRKRVVQTNSKGPVTWRTAYLWTCSTCKNLFFRDLGAEGKHPLS